MLIGNLCENGYLFPAEAPFSTEYKPCNFLEDSAFMGQCDENNIPHGIVQVITKEGVIYRGQMSHGKMQGFGLIAYTFGRSSAGWWKNNNAHGNFYRVCENGNIDEAGWFQDGVLKEDFKEIDEFEKYF